MDNQKVQFGFGQIGNTTPEWAKWSFRIFFYTTQTILLAILMLSDIPAPVKLHITEYVTFANLAVHGLSKMFGVPDDTTKYYEDQPQLKRVPPTDNPPAA